MADITYLFNWIPKNSGITIEDSEDIVEIKYNSKTQATYTKSVSEETLKEHVNKLNLEWVLK